MELIRGVVRHYHWGRPDFIPEWLGSTPDGTPHAELWFGAHPSDPSTVVSTGQPLDEVIELPFLAKILAAGAPLSIQVHPDTAQAQEGYQRENDAGTAIDAPDRTYRDASAKPELVCAVTPFTAKCGLRDLAATQDLLDLIPTDALDDLRETLAGGRHGADAYDAAVRYLFSLDEQHTGQLSSAVAEAASTVPAGSDFDDEITWTGRLAREYPGDIGVVVALLLNHVVLQPGEALFLGAGNMHSYLDGVAIEVMAPSDNVVRGGLTSKHIDTGELMDLLDPRPITPQVQRPSSPCHDYQVPDGVFGLTRLSLRDGEGPVDIVGPGIVILTDADLRLSTATGDLRAERGSAVLLDDADGPVSVTGSGTAHVAHAG